MSTPENNKESTLVGPKMDAESLVAEWTRDGISAGELIEALDEGNLAMQDLEAVDELLLQEEEQLDQQAASLQESIQEALNYAREKEISIDVSQADFTSLLRLIEKKGKRNTAGDQQYTYYDSKGARHALIAIKDGDKVKQITVWAYINGQMDQEHSFVYVISPEDGVHTRTRAPYDSDLPLLYHSIEDSDISDVTTGYNEILSEAKKCAIEEK